MRTLLSWSTGKDSAWSLHVLRRRAEVAVVGLVTTVNAAFDRVAMHGVRRALLEGRPSCRPAAACAGDPHPCPNADYERIMGRSWRSRRRGGGAIAFGDLFWKTYGVIAREAHRHWDFPLPLWGIDAGGWRAR